MSATIIEVALNGPWTRKRQPKIPVAADEIASEAIACSKAGASLVHFHAYDVTTGDQTTDVAVIEEIIAGVRDEVGVRLYRAIAGAIRLTLDRGATSISLLHADSDWVGRPWIHNCQSSFRQDGGRFRVGRTRPRGSDFERGSERGTLPLVETTAKAIEAAGGRVASTAAARSILA
ncbi:3-keto-5-aminohexanoate cleavage protein [Sinorhizobium fredii]|uniref:3-keto-5-aminohexanoate cleavage protein n=1 Tax=Rhizobium fredii TaxID=380 RepID=A0A2L0HDB1_RHIFR|nr:3-keto-5-aminohexanoate cleavage protein [Sinorhizobium fredii]AUX79455.1 hypothetical protein NXT3_PC00282 [Sinorhizobium fredii]